MPRNPKVQSGWLRGESWRCRSRPFDRDPIYWPVPDQQPACSNYLNLIDGARLECCSGGAGSALSEPHGAQSDR